MKRFRSSLLISLFIFLFVPGASGSVQYKGDKAYIIDQTGVKWDITQARTLGFKPEKFQYGIGKTAFTPLDDSNIKQQPDVGNLNQRVIGIENDSETHAYSVDKLRYHEIANTHIGKSPIAAAYWPLVNLTAVYSRKINNDTLTIAPSGWTYKNTFVLYDKESESLWYPYKNGLMGIQGKYFKQWLPKLKSEDTQWRKWKNKHPNSKIME